MLSALLFLELFAWMEVTGGNSWPTVATSFRLLSLYMNVGVPAVSHSVKIVVNKAHFLGVAE